MSEVQRWPIAPDRLDLQFGDKRPSFDAREAVAEANRCLYCYDAPCIGACPTSIDIPSFIRKIATNNLRGSARTILASNLLGQSCSRVCPVEVLCEGDCVYTGWGRKPIEIGRLQRFAMESARDASLLPRAPKRNGSKRDASIGLVGAGPASLACAGTLALLGYETIIYEKNDLPGGLNLSGIAPPKIRAEEVLEEVRFIQELGVEIRTGQALGDQISGEKLLEDHAAVFFAPGLGADSFRGLGGARGEGLVGAVDWIASLKLDSTASTESIRSAVVIGGGNTALDVVQELAALGVGEVCLVYRRSESEMPGYEHEWGAARKLGVRLIQEAAIAKVNRDADGALLGIELVRTHEGRPTGESLAQIDCELVVVATGQERLLELAAQFPGVACDELGCVIADEESLVTGHPRVFTGGDCRNGGKEVVNAVDEGQRAARAIDRLLQGES